MHQQNSFERKVESVRRIITINPTSVPYQISKIFGIFMSFFTSFNYAYYAAFLGQLSSEDMHNFMVFHQWSTIYFALDLVVNVLVEEHNPAKDGFWTIRKSLEKQIKQGRLVYDLVAIVPFKEVADYFLRNNDNNILYAIKAVRLV